MAEAGTNGRGRQSDAARLLLAAARERFAVAATDLLLPDAARLSERLLIWFNLALVFPRLGIPGIWTGRTVDIITPVVATLVGLGLNQGAYTSEIVRAGLLSVDSGQHEAAKSIGMSYFTALRRIILPQAMRVVVPPLGNEFIALVKFTSLASIIGFSDLLRNVQDIYYVNAKVIELLMVAAFWYLVVVTLLSVAQSALERRYGRGFASGVRR